MASQLDVYNLALSNLNSSATVQSINDNSNEAAACNRFYDTSRQKVLERAFWDFATKSPPLTLVLDQNTLPISAIVYPGFRYVYQRPQDCLRFLAVTTNYGLRVNPFLAFWWRAGAMDCSAGSWGPFRPPYVIRLDQTNQANPGQSLVLLTDQDSAYGVYVTDVLNVNLWSQSFLECVAWQLSARISGPLSANERAKQTAIQEAERTLTNAFAISVSQQQPDPYPDSPAITARN